MKAIIVIAFSLVLAQCANSPPTSSLCMVGEEMAEHQGHARSFLDLRYAWSSLRRAGQEVDYEVTSGERKKLPSSADTLCHVAEGTRAMNTKIRMKDRNEFILISDSIIERSVEYRRLAADFPLKSSSPVEQDVSRLRSISWMCFFTKCRY